MTDFTDVFTQSSIDTSLVRRRRVPKTHGHDNPFESATRSNHHGVLDVIWVHQGLEERVCHVDLTPDFSFCTVVQYVFDSWKGICIHNGVCVNLPIVVNPTWKCGLVGFGDDEGRRCVWGV